jgi:riboflavin synthase
MFTGIIETTGRLQARHDAAGGARLTVAPDRPLAEPLATGESIAVCGVCLTVEPESRADRLVFFLSAETLSRSTLGRLETGALVNLERAMRADGRLGGHLVMGHVDGIGTVRRLERAGEAWELEVAFPAELAPLIAPKGSVAVDGISLTLVEVRRDTFTVAVIPHTIEATHLAHVRRGMDVTLEADVIARYVVRALETMGQTPGARVTGDLLRRAGFTS